MQERRYRPGDVLDDYCPRERRITDHAIVAMIEDDIRRTRCAVCDAEHEYKEAKVPAPRRKTQPPALFTQVLEGLNAPAPPQSPVESVPIAAPESAHADGDRHRDQPAEAVSASEERDELRDDQPGEAEPLFRRSLIRATFPRPEGQPPPARALPEFTIQSLHNRGRQRNAGGHNKFRGRRQGGNPMDNIGPMRFRDQGNSGGGQGQGGGRRRRGGKKNR